LKSGSFGDYPGRRGRSEKAKIANTGRTLPSEVGKTQEDLPQLIHRTIMPILTDPSQIAHAAINTLARYYPTQTTAPVQNPQQNLPDIMSTATSTITNNPAEVAHAAITSLSNENAKLRRRLAAGVFPQDPVTPSRLAAVLHDLEVAKYRNQELQAKHEEDLAIRQDLVRQLQEAQDQIGCLTEELSCRYEINKRVFCHENVGVKRRRKGDAEPVQQTAQDGVRREDCQEEDSMSLD
jgi:hypothetical protein